MIQFFAAFGVFLALHSIPASPRIRTALIGLLSHGGYIAVYSVVSILALGWLFVEAFRLDYMELWMPQPWQAVVTLILAPIGLFLVLVGLISRNPFSITMRKQSGEGAVVSVTRHPVLWGFLCWSIGHIPPNGDVRSVLLFGGFAAFSVGGFFMLEKKAAHSLGTAWQDETARSSVMPFVAIVSGRARLRVDRPMLSAFGLTIISVAVLLAGIHADLFGADPLLYITALVNG